MPSLLTLFDLQELVNWHVGELGLLARGPVHREGFDSVVFTEAKVEYAAVLASRPLTTLYLSGQDIVAYVDLYDCSDGVSVRLPLGVGWPRPARQLHFEIVVAVLGLVIDRISTTQPSLVSRLVISK